MAAKLKTIKNIHLTHVSRVFNQLEAVLSEDEPDISKMKKYLKMLDEKYAKVLKDSEDLQEELTEPNEIEKEINDMDTLEDKIINVKHKAEEFLEDKDVAGIKGNDALNATLTLIDKMQRDSSTQKRERTSLIPAIELPRFDGSIDKYEEFIDSFEAIIQNHPDIEDVERFIFLKRHLDPPASDLLEGFSTTNTDYRQALELFKETYGNKSLLRQIRISKLLNIEHHDGKSSLRNIYNQIRTHIRSLESLGVNAEDYSLFLTPIVLSKLKRDMNKKWYRKNDDSINHLLNFIQAEVESTESAIHLEDAFSSTTKKDHTVTDKKRYSENKNSYRSDRDMRHRDYYKQDNTSRSSYKPSTATALHTNTQKWCYYCQIENHDTQNCRKLSKVHSSEVRNFLNSQKLCYCCLKKGHNSAQCFHKQKLVCELCNGNHHTYLHEGKPEFISKESSEPSQTDAHSRPIIKSTTANTYSTQTVIFQTANAYLMNHKHQKEKIKVVYDQCSDRSYISTNASSKVKLKYHEENLEVSGYNGRSDGIKKYKIRHAIIESITRPNTSRFVKLVETDKICPPIHRQALPNNLLKCHYLQGIDLAEDYASSSDDEIHVLIGLDYYWEFVSGRVRREKHKPIAVESILGWMLQANSVDESLQPSNVTSLFITATEGSEINSQLKKFWEVEEVDSSKELPWSPEEIKVHDKFKATITHQPDRQYQARLPVREEITTLSSNKSGAINRHKNLIKRFIKNAELGAKYREAMKEFLDNGFSEKVIEDTEPDICFYLPHHPVLKEDSLTTNVRPVFEGNAFDVNSKSLNDCLFKGPTLQPLLNAVLMRFRLRPIAFTADVKKMFLMIRIHPDDRDLLRYLWEDPDDETMCTYRLKVLPFGLTCSSYIAIATVQHHVSSYLKEYPHIVNELVENVYIDDLLTGANSLIDAISDYETEVNILKEGGMELRKWTSNNSELNERFKADQVASPGD